MDLPTGVRDPMDQPRKCQAHGGFNTPSHRKTPIPLRSFVARERKIHSCAQLNAHRSDPGNLEPASRRLALSLRGMHIAEIEQTPGQCDRQPERGSLDEVGMVNVAAVMMGQERGKCFGRRRGDAAKKGSRRDRDRLFAQEIGQAGHPTVNVPVVHVPGLFRQLFAGH